MKKLISLLLAVITAAALLSGCDAGSSSSTPKKSNNVNVETSTQPKNRVTRNSNGTIDTYYDAVRDRSWQYYYDNNGVFQYRMCRIIPELDYTRTQDVEYANTSATAYFFKESYGGTDNEYVYALEISYRIAEVIKGKPYGTFVLNLGEWKVGKSGRNETVFSEAFRFNVPDDDEVSGLVELNELMAPVNSYYIRCSGANKGTSTTFRSESSVTAIYLVSDYYKES